MNNLRISAGILEKLASKTPPVTRREVEQCFQNRTGGLLEDTREKNKTVPPTQWFIAMTNANRVLKVIFVQNGQDVFLKSAYDPDAEERRIYAKYG